MEVVTFDVGNVIIKADHKLTHKALEKLGVLPENAKKFYENKEYKDFSKGKITGEEFYQVLTTKYLKTSLSYKQVLNAYNQHIYALDEEVKRVLDTLQARNVHLAFITDTNIWQTARERQLIDLGEYSSVIVRSNEIGKRKTDGGAFEYLCQQLDADPEKILLIDDSEDKIEVAEKFGLKTLHFLNADKLVSYLKQLRIL